MLSHCLTHEPVAGVAIGYPGDVNTLPDAIKLRTLAARARKPVADFVFAGTWGQKAPTL